MKHYLNAILDLSKEPSLTEEECLVLNNIAKKIIDREINIFRLNDKEIEVYQFVGKIGCIKEVRKRTGMGLLEAKRFVEEGAIRLGIKSKYER